MGHDEGFEIIFYSLAGQRTRVYFRASDQASSIEGLRSRSSRSKNDEIREQMPAVR